jgi:hypothetical protein
MNKSLSALSVKRFYFDHFSELNLEQKVHFAWSLYMWNGDKEAYRHLLALRPELTCNGDLNKVYRQIVAESMSNTHGKAKMATIHIKYFSRHPGLLAKMWQLIHLLRLKTIYGVDAREDLLRFTPLSDFQQTLRALEDDPEAIAMLSCGAINFIYLVNYLLLDRPNAVSPTTVLQDCLPFYDMKDGMHLKILSYLYTHFVINESLFFSRPIPPEKLAEYQLLMTEADKVIAGNYFKHSLDNKYEFLACAHLVGNTSDLEPIISDEAANSVVDGGLYTADTLNRNPNKHPSSIPNMAHSMAFYVLYNKKKPLFREV